jgi:hypothetical protein
MKSRQPKFHGQKLNILNNDHFVFCYQDSENHQYRNSKALRLKCPELDESQVDWHDL